MALKDKIRVRRDTTANFTSANPVLSLGEISFDTTAKQFKVGDGLTTWTSLPYSSVAASLITGTLSKSQQHAQTAYLDQSAVFTQSVTIAGIQIQKDNSTPSYNDYWRAWVTSFDVNSPHSADLNTVFRWGFNVSSGGGRVNASDAEFHDSIESNFYLPDGTNVLERHWQAQTKQGTITRYVSALIPKNDADRDQSQVILSSDSIVVYDWDSNQKIKFDFIDSNLSKVEYIDPTTAKYPSQNGVLWTQKNAADNAFVDGPTLNAANAWQFPADVVIASNATSYTPEGVFAVRRNGVISNNEVVSEVSIEDGNSSSKAIAHKSHGLVHGGIENLVENISDQSTGFASMRIKTANGGGDSKLVLETITSSVCIGIDVSDSDAIVLATGQTPGGSSNLLRFDRSTGDARFKGTKISLGSATSPVNFFESVSSGLVKLTGSDNATLVELLVSSIQAGVDSFEINVGSRLKLGAIAGDTGWMGFQNTASNSSSFSHAALIQNASGQTIVNCSSGQSISLRHGNSEVGKFDGNSDANSTRFLLWDNDSGTVKRVVLGASDSGGTGYRMLRIAN